MVREGGPPTTLSGTREVVDGKKNLSRSREAGRIFTQRHKATKSFTHWRVASFALRLRRKEGWSLLLCVFV
jgi:hypothetical protein